MMEGVDVQTPLAVKSVKKGIFLEGDSVGGLGAVGILRMLDGGLGGDILRDLATKGDSERLNAATDAKHGQLTVVGQTRDQQLWEIALGVDTTQLGRGFFACPEGIDITTTTEDEGIDTRKCLDDDISIGHRGNDKGNAASTDHRLIVALAKLKTKVIVVASDANNGPTVGLREAGIDFVEIRLQLVCAHKRATFLRQGR